VENAYVLWVNPRILVENEAVQGGNGPRSVVEDLSGEVESHDPLCMSESRLLAGRSVARS
jgi:hypothetical protein